MHVYQVGGIHKNCIYTYQGWSCRKYINIGFDLGHKSEQCDWLRVKSSLRLKYFREHLSLLASMVSVLYMLFNLWLLYKVRTDTTCIVVPVRYMYIHDILYIVTPWNRSLCYQVMSKHTLVTTVHKEYSIWKLICYLTVGACMCVEQFLELTNQY